MRFTKALIAATTIVVALSAVALAQKTSYDFDKTADFSRFKTYTLKEGTNVGDPLIDRRFVSAIEAQLKEKGFTRDDANPNVVVVYHVAFDKEKDITSYSTGVGYGPYGYRWGGGWGTTDVRVREILMGTLVIDIADAGKQEVVWRGVGVKEVDTQASPERRDRNINSAVEKILKNYPPKQKK